MSNFLAFKTSCFKQFSPSTEERWGKEISQINATPWPNQEDLWTKKATASKQRALEKWTLRRDLELRPWWPATEEWRTGIVLISEGQPDCLAWSRIVLKLAWEVLQVHGQTLEVERSQSEGQLSTIFITQIRAFEGAGRSIPAKELVTFSFPSEFHHRLVTKEEPLSQKGVLGQYGIVIKEEPFSFDRERERESYFGWPVRQHFSKYALWHTT
jgi:hypothetical protein